MLLLGDGSGAASIQKVFSERPEQAARCGNESERMLYCRARSCVDRPLLIKGGVRQEIRPDRLSRFLMTFLDSDLIVDEPTNGEKGAQFVFRIRNRSEPLGEM